MSLIESKKILCIGEDLFELGMLERVLAREQVDQVVLISTLEEFDNLDPKVIPDLILISSRPFAHDVGAFQIYDRLRQVQQFKNIPVILIWVTMPEQEIFTKAQSVGIAGCLDLVRTISDLVDACNTVLAGQTYYPTLGRQYQPYLRR